MTYKIQYFFKFFFEIMQIIIEKELIYSYLEHLYYLLFQKLIFIVMIIFFLFFYKF